MQSVLSFISYRYNNRTDTINLEELSMTCMHKFIVITPWSHITVPQFFRLSIIFVKISILFWPFFMLT